MPTMYLKSSFAFSQGQADFSPHHLNDIIGSVERKKQKLEEDIAQYIRDKQSELQAFELKTMLGVPEHNTTAATSATMGTQIQPLCNVDSNTAVPRTVHADGETDQTEQPAPELEKDAKASKQTWVHKRDQELLGFTTPSFLPLLDASGSQPPKKKAPRSKNTDAKDETEEPTTTEDENMRSSSTHIKSSTLISQEHIKQTQGIGKDLDPTETVGSEESARDGGHKKKKGAETEIKVKSSSRGRKSSLRRQATPKLPGLRRKRVSLVINDQIVHPSDNVQDRAYILPQSDTTCASPKHADLSEALTIINADPKLDTTAQAAETDVLITSTTSPPQLQFEPPQTATQSYLDEIDLGNGMGPMSAEEIGTMAAAGDDDDPAPLSTYVGGLSGSGVDDVDQTGSYGYPSSLGASYMESYMASRPLSVRIAAAEKAELDAEEVKKLIGDDDADADVHGGVEAGEEEEIMGSLEGI
ncbi:hypothetical protein K432DRAFT_447231 [Lepidopterella palustris CBS 459.81]|uniref:Uncharacterized protein n=1 Tax=Lepidopterella palustris CBS 459.81 TaxID=1314670 RepID=A0A8E2J9M2_9PEZI|nr:hypothetical protein K432DRAFT_447231 [Lepidopterella palustris CBS 459.81]